MPSVFVCASVQPYMCVCVLCWVSREIDADCGFVTPETFGPCCGSGGPPGKNWMTLRERLSWILSLMLKCMTCRIAHQLLSMKSVLCLSWDISGLLYAYLNTFLLCLDLSLSMHLFMHILLTCIVSIACFCMYVGLNEFMPTCVLASRPCFTLLWNSRTP